MNLPRVLDGNLHEVRRLHPVSLAVNDNLIPLSNATMVIRKNELVEGRTYVRLYTPNGESEIYRTRVPETAPGEDSATIQLEHAVCEIGDFLVQDAINDEYSVHEAFVTLFSHYRGNKWQLGTFTAEETVVIDCDYDNVLEMMLAVLQQAPQYMMTFDFSTSPWTLSVAEKSSTVTAEGRLSRNVISAQIRKDDKPLCTRVYVKGLPKPSGRESDENAIGYMDADTISTYGVIEKETGGTNLTQSQAERVAVAYLNANKNPKASVELDMIDLSEITGETLDSIRKGKLFRLAVPDEGITITDYITQISWVDVIGDPKHARVKIGDLEDAAIEFLQAQASAVKSSRRGSKKQAKIDDAFDQHFEITDEYGTILEQAGMHLDAHGMIVYATDQVYNIGSVIQQTSSMIRSEVHAANSEIYSTITQTASAIKLEVADTRSGLFSLIEQTPDMIRSEVGSAVSGFATSVIEQTATYIRSEVSNAASSISQSVVEQTTDWVRSEVSSVASGVAWSVVQQTMTNIIQQVGSKARVYVQMSQPTGDLNEGDIWVKSTGKRTWADAAANNGKWADASSFRWKDYAGSEMYVYKSGAWVKIGDDAEVAEQQVTIEHNKESIDIVGHKLDTQGEEYNSKLQVTAEKIRGEVSVSKSQIYSVIEQTATNVFSGVYDEIEGNFSTIEQTSQAITLGVNAAKSSLHAVIAVTATNVFSGVYNEVSDNFSTIEQTEDKISLEVNSAKSSLYSAINATSTQISLKVGKGEVISSINQTAESITINAAKINLSGYVKSTDLTADYLTTRIANFASLTSERGGISVYSVGTTNFSQGGVSCYLPNAIWSLRIQQSGNTYTLQRQRYNDDGWTDVGSFSRATTLSGEWSGNTYTITASPQGNTNSISPQIHPVSSQGGAYFDTYIGTTNGSTWTNHGDAKRFTIDDSGLTVYVKDSNNWVYAQKTLSDSNLTAGNIKSGIYIFGVEGSYVGTTSLSGSWSNGVFTASASPQSQTLKTSLTVGSFSWSGTTGTATIYATIGNSATIYDTGKTASVSDSNLKASNIKSGVTIFGVAGSYAGSGTVSGDDLDLNGNSNSTSSSKPTTAINKGVANFTGYIWHKKSDGTWENLRSFSISTGATHFTTPLYYYAGGSYHQITSDRLVYYTT